MKSEYFPRTFAQILGKLVEECGEVQAAVGKTLRWGTESTNPELPEHEKETNRDWILRELDDLDEAIAIARYALRKRTTPRKYSATQSTAGLAGNVSVDRNRKNQKLETALTVAVAAVIGLDAKCRSKGIDPGDYFETVRKLADAALGDTDD